MEGKCPGSCWSLTRQHDCRWLCIYRCVCVKWPHSKPAFQWEMKTKTCTLSIIMWFSCHGYMVSLKSSYITHKPYTAEVWPISHRQADTHTDVHARTHVRTHIHTWVHCEFVRAVVSHSVKMAETGPKLEALVQLDQMGKIPARIL